MTLDPSKLPPPVREKPKAKPRLVLRVPASTTQKPETEKPAGAATNPEAEFLKAWQSNLEEKEQRLEELAAELEQREAYIESRENFYSNRPQHSLAQ